MKHVIEVKGAIVSNDDKWVYDLFEMEHTSPKCIDKAIAESKGKDAVVQINSGGGSVFAGSEIYTKLKQLNVDVEIIGLAGSAASFIAMAGKKVSISPTAQIMVHNASTITQGDKNAMTETGDFLNSIDSSIAYAYQLKTGLEHEELSEMMNKETWLNAQDALEKGFADEIMFTEPVDAVASVESIMLPNHVINKVRNMMKEEPNDVLARLEAIENKLKLVDSDDYKQPEQKPVNNWLF